MSKTFQHYHLMKFISIIICPALWANDAPVPPKQQWSFNRIFGTFDRAAMQRGFQVYKEVCSTCHSLKHLSYGKLTALGFSEAEVKAIAQTHEVTALNDDGNPISVPAGLSNYITGPYANAKAARAANNGALPPDLTVITKARTYGPNYIYALLNGFRNPPPGIKLSPGMHYNLYFPGHQIAMAQPLSAGQVTYADGTPNTVAQMAHDVTTFLSWTAEPELEYRKRMGVKVLIFLAIFATMLYIVMCRTWAKIQNQSEIRQKEE